MLRLHRRRPQKKPCRGMAQTARETMRQLHCTTALTQPQANRADRITIPQHLDGPCDAFSSAKKPLGVENCKRRKKKEKKKKETPQFLLRVVQPETPNWRRWMPSSALATARRGTPICLRWRDTMTLPWPYALPFQVSVAGMG